METDDFVSRLLSKGNNLMCGDHKKFGDMLYVQFVDAFFECVARWYRRNNPDLPANYETVIRCLGRETSHAQHLMLNLVYQCSGGIPSGCPVTIIVDVYVNQCYMRVAWLMCMESSKRFSFATLDAYREEVEEIFYGDDVVLSISDRCIDDFNAVTIGQALAKYDLTFTNASKGDEMIPCSKIGESDTTFLKCRFVRHPFRNCWMAQLDERAVLETSNWTWNTQPDLQYASVYACKEMVSLAFGQGPEYYSQLRRKVIDYWSKKNISVTIPTWAQKDLQIYDEN